LATRSVQPVWWLAPIPFCLGDENVIEKDAPRYLIDCVDLSVMVRPRFAKSLDPHFYDLIHFQDLTDSV
jgi:hypothetical protein